MPRYVDADTWESYFYEHMDDAHMAAAKNALDDMPTIDAVEVVRCEKCKWQRKWLLDNGYYWYECRNGNEALGLDGEFCSDGERRTEDDLRSN